MASPARRRRRAARYATLVVIAALVLVAGFAPGHAAAVTNAFSTTQMPWAVRLIFTNASNQERFCTGVALTQHWIVTAAHCLRGRAVSTDRARVDLGEGNSTLYPMGRASYYNHPDYDGKGDKADDIGLVRLYGEGVFPERRAKVYYGANVDDPKRWKRGATIAFIAGYGWGTDYGLGEDCDDPDRTIGIKRLGRYKLTGNTDDHGLLGFGNPLAVQADRIGSSPCEGDSGGPWTFAVGGRPDGEMFVFAVHSGRSPSHLLFGKKHPWGTLIKRAWIAKTTQARGLPIDCRTFDVSGYYRHKQCTEGYWMVSSGARAKPRRLKSSSTALSDVLFTDLNGDGTQDAVRPSRDRWYASSSGRGEWTPISGYLPTALAFGDFDGDGAGDDVFYSSGTAWYVGYSGGTSQHVKSFSAPPDRLRFGDFDGDGSDDVFDAVGGAWHVVYSTKNAGGPWSEATVGYSRVARSRLRFGDFDGDGADDVFRSSGDAWYVSYATKERTTWSRWRNVNRSAVPSGRLRFGGDFDGDGADDVFRSSGEAWYVSYATKDRTTWSSWREINRFRFDVPVPSFSFSTFADVTGDGRSDVLYYSTAQRKAFPSSDSDARPSDRICLKKPWTPGCE